MNALYAFWDYDQKPYYLGGKVVEVLRNGFVKVEGLNGSFRPVIILPLEQGLEIQKELSRLTIDYKEKVQALDDEYTKNVNKLLGR